MSEPENAIQVTHVSKTFKLPHERHSSIKSALLSLHKRGKSFERQHVLDDISFEIKKGEFFGIVGRNGSGKSTLLKLLAGIYSADKGTIAINGSLTPFIELGVGFNPELTGRENVYLNGSLLGFSHKDMEAMYDDIVEFAELDRFMDQKLKNYSSGMQVRLAFSIAIRARSDILLLDEVLAVGDAIFQHKCFAYFKELKRRKQTVIFVSHDSTTLQEYCDRGILLEKGKIVSRGKITKVVQDYVDILNEHEAAQDATLAMKQPDKEIGKHRWGNGDIMIAKGSGFGSEGGQQSIFTDKDGYIGIRIEYEAQRAAVKPVYGITVIEPSGQRVFDSNTMWSKIKTGEVAAGQHVTVEWRIPNVFNSGEYTVAPAVADEFGTTIYDWREEVVRFKVRKAQHASAYVNVAHKIKVSSAPKNSTMKSE